MPRSLGILLDPGHNPRLLGRAAIRQRTSGNPTLITAVNTPYSYLIELFLVSFGAATLLPLGSEWLLVALLMDGKPVWPSILSATAGNYLGACTTYIIGFAGADFLIKKILRIKPEHQERAANFYNRYGKWSLLLSWIPILGDPLCLIGGLEKLPFGTYSILVIAGKFARYTAVAALTLL